MLNEKESGHSHLNWIYGDQSLVLILPKKDMELLQNILQDNLGFYIGLQHTMFFEVDL